MELHTHLYGVWYGLYYGVKYGVFFSNIFIATRGTNSPLAGLFHVRAVSSMTHFISARCASLAERFYTIERNFLLHKKGDSQPRHKSPVNTNYVSYFVFLLFLIHRILHHSILLYKYLSYLTNVFLSRLRFQTYAMHLQLRFG